MSKTVGLGATEGIDNYFNDTIFKTLLTQIAPRLINKIQRADAITKLITMMDQIESIVTLSQNITFAAIGGFCEGFIALKPNLLVRTFLDTHLVTTVGDSNRLFFNLVPVKNVILQTLHEFGVEKSYETNELYLSFVDKVCLVVHETLYKFLRNQYRQQREYPKVFQDFAILVHEAVKLSSPHRVLTAIVEQHG